MDKYFKPNDMVNGYRVIKIIGQGRYGIAYLAKNNQGEKCVIKQLKSKMLNVTRDKLFYEEDMELHIWLKTIKGKNVLLSN